jgi:hypothetical protein
MPSFYVSFRHAWLNYPNFVCVARERRIRSAPRLRMEESIRHSRRRGAERESCEASEYRLTVVGEEVCEM